MTLFSYSMRLVLQFKSFFFPQVGYYRKTPRLRNGDLAHLKMYDWNEYVRPRKC